jgi:hypothetical protein
VRHKPSIPFLESLKIAADRSGATDFLKLLLQLVADKLGRITRDISAMARDVAYKRRADKPIGRARRKKQRINFRGQICVGVGDL